MTSSKNGVISSAYRDLAVAFLIMEFIVTVVRAMLKEAYGDGYINYILVLFFPSAVVLFPLAVRVIIKLKAESNLIRAILGMFLTGIILRITAIFVFAKSPGQFYLNIASSLIIIAFLFIVIYRMTLNLFGENNHIVEKLWASVCVYFMIGLLFATFYSILILINPGAMNIHIQHPAEVYLTGVVFSFNILSGFDPVYQPLSESFQMGAIMESTVSTLFLVVLMGRLLGSSN